MKKTYIYIYSVKRLNSARIVTKYCSNNNRINFLEFINFNQFHTYYIIYNSLFKLNNLTVFNSLNSSLINFFILSISLNKRNEENFFLYFLTSNKIAFNNYLISFYVLNDLNYLINKIDGLPNNSEIAIFTKIFLKFKYVNSHNLIYSNNLFLNNYLFLSRLKIKLSYNTNNLNTNQQLLECNYYNFVDNDINYFLKNNNFYKIKFVDFKNFKFNICNSNIQVLFLEINKIFKIANYTKYNLLHETGLLNFHHNLLKNFNFNFVKNYSINLYDQNRIDLINLYFNDCFRLQPLNSLKFCIAAKELNGFFLELYNLKRELTSVELNLNKTN